MHGVHIVLPGLGQILLGHLPDRVRLVDHEVLAQPLVIPVDGEVRPCDYAQDEAFLVILHGVHLHPSLRVEGNEVLHHRRGVNEGYFEHPGLVIRDERIEHREAVYRNHRRVILW